jgi:hypothetical protein
MAVTQLDASPVAETKNERKAALPDLLLSLRPLRREMGDGALDERPVTLREERLIGLPIKENDVQGRRRYQQQ